MSLKECFHSDTMKTTGNYLLDMEELDIHFITCAAHNFHRPKRYQLLYVNNRLKNNPFILSGSISEKESIITEENGFKCIGIYFFCADQSRTDTPVLYGRD